MHIQLTGDAEKQLRPITGKRDAVFKLVYDAEGCGCAVSGVPALWILSGSDVQENDRAALVEPYTIVYEPRHEVFFEDRLKLDYHAGKRSFILSSSNQIYSNDLAIVDKRDG